MSSKYRKGARNYVRITGSMWTSSLEYGSIGIDDFPVVELGIAHVRSIVASKGCGLPSTPYVATGAF